MLQKTLKLRSLTCYQSQSIWGTTNLEVHNCYKGKLISVNKAHVSEVEVLDQGKKCASIPKRESLEWIRKLKNMEIYASDIFERETLLWFEQNLQEIYLLLGADVAGTIFTEIIKLFQH